VRAQRWIVITSINHPTEAIRRLADVSKGWTLLVVGDRKTPKDWHCEGVRYLGIEEQTQLGFALGREAPFNHYARKNLGYLYAIQNGAELLMETDDDNYPYDWYPGDVSNPVGGRLVAKGGWENVYTHFTNSRIWPRGFPLELVNESLRRKSDLGERSEYNCVIQQFLANENPDVDAVFRLTNEVMEHFEGEDVVLGPGTWCPFNSQNTLWQPAAFVCLYLPFTASFRMTDIWRSFAAQVCVQSLRGNIAFRQASMFQRRNEHNLIRDFADEISGYLNNHAIMARLSALAFEYEESAGARLRRCYGEMVDGRYLRADEMRYADYWLEDYALAVDRNSAGVDAAAEPDLLPEAV
jgi:hypothetical protein